MTWRFRLNALTKYFFSQDMHDINNTNQAMKLCEESLRLITAIKLYENYLDRNARMSWEDFRDKVDEAITHHSNPELTGFKSGGCIRRSLVFGTGDLRI